jgi:hypothetical protein
MKKIYELDLYDLADKLPKSQYDNNKKYECCEYVSVDRENKQKFITEFTKIFKQYLQDKLELKYECESCGGAYDHKSDIYKAICGHDICDWCNTDEDICEKCWKEKYPNW